MTKNKWFSIASLTVTSALVFVPLVAVAQVVPNSAIPSHIEDRFNNKLTEPAKPVAPFIPEPKPAKPTPLTGKAAETFVLRSVVIDDSTVYPAGTFNALFEHHINKSITLNDAREIAANITTRYRNDGYILTQAVITGQNLSDGILHIHVVEGFFDKVIIENDNLERDRRNLIAAYAEKIRKEHPINIRTLERYMLLITDLPGVNAQSVIKPSTSTMGAADCDWHGLTIPDSPRADDGV